MMVLKIFLYLKTLITERSLLEIIMKSKLDSFVFVELEEKLRVDSLDITFFDVVPLPVFGLDL